MDMVHFKYLYLNERRVIRNEELLVATTGMRQYESHAQSCCRLQSS